MGAVPSWYRNVLETTKHNTILNKRAAAILLAQVYWCTVLKRLTNIKDIESWFESNGVAC